MQSDLIETLPSTLYIRQCHRIMNFDVVSPPIPLRTLNFADLSSLLRPCSYSRRSSLRSRRQLLVVPRRIAIVSSPNASTIRRPTVPRVGRLTHSDVATCCTRQSRASSGRLWRGGKMRVMRQGRSARRMHRLAAGHRLDGRVDDDGAHRVDGRRGA